MNSSEGARDSSSSERLTVLIVDPHLLDRSGGGNQVTQSLIMRYTDKSKFRLVLAVPVVSEFAKQVNAWGIECEVVEPPSRLLRYGGQALRDGVLGRARTVVDIVRYNLRLLSLIRAKSVDAVYCNCLRSYLYVGLAAKLARRPVLWYIKGDLGNPLLDFVALMAADRIAFNGRTNKWARYPALIRRLEKKVRVIPNGLDLHRVTEVEAQDHSQLRAELALQSHTVNLAYLGLIYRPKGVDDLLHALARVRRQCSEFRLYVIGDCSSDQHLPYKRELEEIVHSKGLDDHVIFLGWRWDALEILSLMDVLVHPSLSEGFPRAVLEAMALGKAIVATRVGALRADDVIRNGHEGFLVEPRDIETMAKHILALVNDRALRQRMGRAAKQKAFENYAIHNQIRQLEDTWSGMV